MTRRPYSSRVLALSGLILIGMGLYFVLLRPALLPEDVRYIGTDVPEIRATVRGLLDWLEKVFWVMGGYILTIDRAVDPLRITHFVPKPYQGCLWRGDPCGTGVDRLDGRGELYHRLRLQVAAGGLCCLVGRRFGALLARRSG
jgi:hypothetical protein